MNFPAPRVKPEKGSSLVTQLLPNHGEKQGTQQQKITLTTAAPSGSRQ